MGLISVIAVILVVVISSVYLYFKNRFNYWRLRGIPHEKAIFPFGNAKGLGKKFHHSIFGKRIYDQFKGQAKLCGVYILAGPVAMILDLDLVKNVLVKDFGNFSDRGLYHNQKDDPLSAHLFSLDGSKWKQLRAKISPTFTSGKMKFMFPSIIEVGERFRDALCEIFKLHDELEIKDLLARFTTDVIGTCAFGIDCNSLKDPNAEFRKMGQKAFIPRRAPILMILMHGFRSISKMLRVKVMADDVTEFFMRVVRETVEYREKNNISRNDFMDILIKLKNDNDESLTFNEIASQAFLVFLAGFETSSTTLTFCLYELAINPDIQTKARRVVQEAFKKHGSFTYEMMIDMPYIDQVLQETLRKYPPVATLSRETQNDYRVPGTDQIIEKGTIVTIPVYAIQRDGQIYPSPDQFDPERFSSEQVLSRDNMAWLPFGEGPRNCVGLRFGMMQARIGLTMLLNTFEFSISSKTRMPLEFEPYSFVLSPKGGIFLKLSPLRL